MEHGGRTRQDDARTFDERQAATRSLAEAVLHDDWTAYVVESETAPDPIDGRMSTIVQPGDVWLLPDGRVGAVMFELVPPGTIADRAAWLEHSVMFQIFTPETGRWLLDETLWLCSARCDEPTAEAATSCIAAEIYNDPINAPFMSDAFLQNLPWIEVDTGSIDYVLLGLLWYGDRPLEVNGVFADDSRGAKLMWYSSVPIRSLQITARPAGDPAATPVSVQASAANSAANGPSAMWPSTMSLPKAGCWEITLTGSNADTGAQVTGTVVMEAIAPSTATPES